MQQQNDASMQESDMFDGSVMYQLQGLDESRLEALTLDDAAPYDSEFNDSENPFQEELPEFDNSELGDLDAIAEGSQVDLGQVYEALADSQRENERISSSYQELLSHAAMLQEQLDLIKQQPQQNPNDEKIEQLKLSSSNQLAEIQKLRLETEDLRAENAALTQKIAQKQSEVESIESIKENLRKESMAELVQLKRELLIQKEKELLELKRSISLKNEQDQSSQTEYSIESLQELELALNTFYRRFSEFNNSNSDDCNRAKYICDGIYGKFKSLEEEIAYLKDTNACLPESVDFCAQTTFATSVDDFKRNHPNLYSEIESEFNFKNEILLQTRLKQLKVEFQQEKIKIKQESKVQVEQISESLRKQCNDAYEEAVAKIEMEYTGIYESLKLQFEQEKRLLKSPIEPSSHELLKQQIESLKITRETEIQQAIESTRLEYVQKIEDLKQKYIATLQKMKQDVQMSKSKSMERLETEWKRRKADLEKEFKIKYNIFY